MPVYATPDPSAGTAAVYVVGFLGDGLDWVRLVVLAVVVVGVVGVFALGALAGLAMRR